MQDGLNVKQQRMDKRTTIFATRNTEGTAIKQDGGLW